MFVVCFVVSFLYTPLAVAEEHKLSSPLTMLMGYGFTHTSLGKTKQWVETIDLVGRYEYGGTEDIGESWYLGRHSLLVELPVHFVVDPAASPMVGLAFLACYRFTNLGKLQPYGFAGGGPLYSGSKIEGMGTHWNGNWQLGVGLRLPRPDGHDLKFEYRFHHISNGGRTEPNDPLNSSKVLVGISF